MVVVELTVVEDVDVVGIALKKNFIMKFVKIIRLSEIFLLVVVVTVALLVEVDDIEVVVVEA